MNLNKLAKDIINLIKIIPGIIGFCDFNTKEEEENIDNLNENFIIDLFINNENKLSIKVAIIIAQNVSSKKISIEIENLISNLCKKENVKLGCINTYIMKLK